MSTATHDRTLPNANVIAAVVRGPYPNRPAFAAADYSMTSPRSRCERGRAGNQRDRHEPLPLTAFQVFAARSLQQIVAVLDVRLSAGARRLTPVT